MDDITVKVNGQEIEKLDLLSVVVDTNLYLPAMCMLTLRDDNEGKYVDGTTFKIKGEMEVKIVTDAGVNNTLFKGEIIALEPIFTEGGVTQLRIRAYDKAHRLTWGKKTRTFVKVTDGDIFSTIAQQHGLSARVDNSGGAGVVYEYVIQNNLTDSEFIWNRARAIGYQVYFEENKIHFQPATKPRGGTRPVCTLTWKEHTLSSFEPRVTAMHQVGSTLVKGWDVKKKETIIGKASPQGPTTKTKVVTNGSKLTFESKVANVIVNQPVWTQKQADAMAKALAASSESEVIQAEGVCGQGDPRVLAGRLVTVEGVGKQFSGDYFVTEARHVFRDNQYFTTFNGTSHVPYTLSHLLASQNGHGSNTANGVVVAIVTDLQDPEDLGRVKVTYPWLDTEPGGAKLSSHWARIATPFGGKERGFFFLPEVDDEVLIAFEHGSMEHPYIVGSLWNGKEKPPVPLADAVRNGKVARRMIKSRSGHIIELNDEEGKESIIIKDNRDNAIEFRTSDNFMLISSKYDLKISAGGKLDIKATGKLSITSDADVTVNGMNLKLSASSGAQLQGNSKVDVTSGGVVSVKGSLTKIG